MSEIKKVSEFLKELGEISKKHKIYINAWNSSCLNTDSKSVYTDLSFDEEENCYTVYSVSNNLCILGK